MRFAPLGIAILSTILLIGWRPGQALVAQQPALVSAAAPRAPAEERNGFHLPAGFEIQLVVSEPAIHKPVNLAFDDRGRLWLTETVEYPFPAQAGARPRDAVKILEDIGPDGHAAKVGTFADGLNIPIGLLPLAHGALVYSIPNIYRMSDRHGTGRAERREVLYGSFGYSDTHGMASHFTWGFDGWIYANHGFANTSVVKGSDGRAITMHSGSTFRMRPDGSHVELFAHGQVNPFGLTFDPLGDLFSCDCETKPISMLLRGAYYPSFGIPDDGLGFAPEMMTHMHGSTAIAGLTYYAADHFPAAYRDTFFVGNVVTNRIHNDRPQRHGSTLVVETQPDFLTSDDPWFRPVDIKLGPDGALYVADFYNRIIGHYEVPLTHPGRDRERGRIWRIVYRGPDGKTRPMAPRGDWTRASVAELIDDLGHPNLVVRMKATNQLVERGGRDLIAAVQAAMQTPADPWRRVHGLWVLDRLGALDDRTLEAAARDPADELRVHAQRVLAERRELPRSLHLLALAGLKDPDAFVRRAAADALGQHPARENIRPLLDLRQSVPLADTHLLHVARMALRDQLRSGDSWAALPAVLHGERDWRAVADVATGVPSAAAADFLLRHLRRVPEGGEDRVRFLHHIARYGSGATLLLLEFARGDHAGGVERQVALFKAIQQGIQERGGALDAAARSWAAELSRTLIASSKPEDVLKGIDLASTLKLEGLRDLLLALVRSDRASEAIRGAALGALATIEPDRQVALLGRILADAAAPLALRERAANELGGIGRAEAQAALLAGLPAAAGRLQTSIAVGLAGSRAGAEKLLQAVADGKASPRLLQERAVELRLNASKLPDLKERLAPLTSGLPPADQRLQELLERRRAGFRAARTDPARGAQVFAKTCALCHRLGGEGAKIGPQLDGIGVRGVDRLLEDVLDPNRNVDRAFRVTTLALKDGRLVSGLLLREEGEVLVLADSQGKEIRVPKSSVEERTISPLSPMPANFAEQIPEPDFYHLLAFLLAQHPAEKSNK